MLTSIGNLTKGESLLTMEDDAMVRVVTIEVLDVGADS